MSEQSSPTVGSAEPHPSDYSVEIPFRVAYDLGPSTVSVPPEHVAVIGAALQLLFPDRGTADQWQILGRAEQMQRLLSFGGVQR